MLPPILLTGSPEFAPTTHRSPVVEGLASLVSSTSLHSHAATMPDSPNAWPRSRPTSRPSSRNSTLTRSPSVSPTSAFATLPGSSIPTLVAPVPHRAGSGARALPVPQFRAISPPPSPKSQSGGAGWIRLPERPLLLVDDPLQAPEVTARSRSVMERIQALADMTDSTVFDVLRRLSDAERASAAIAEPVTEARLRTMLEEENIIGLSIAAALNLQLPETTWRQAYDEVLQDVNPTVGLASRLYWRAFAKSERLREFRRAPMRRESLRRSISSSAAD